MNHPPSLETTRLRLEPLRVEDADEWWQAIWCDADVTRYLPSREPLPLEKMPQLLARANQHWKAHNLGIWSIRDKQRGELLGHCGLLLNEPPDVELIYAFARSAWGRGLATEAAGCLINYAFEHRGFDHLNALVVPENVASARVLQKLGFIRAGETNRFEVQLHAYTLRK